MQNVHALPAGLMLAEEVVLRFQIVQAYYQGGEA